MENNEKKANPESGESHHEHGHGHAHGHEHGHEHVVTITIDTKPHKVKPGQYTVAAIKQIGNVPLAYDLEELVGGKLTPLADGGSVTIKGGEVFLSHPKDGGAS